MTPYLLDTNHCSLVFKGNPNVIQQLNVYGDTQVVTSVIVCGELVYMAHKSVQREQNLRHIEHLLNRLTIYHLDARVADWYGTLKASLIERFGPKDKPRRHRTKIESLGISENDLWIAATAQRYACTVVTADRDFERIAQVTPLSLECWI